MRILTISLLLLLSSVHLSAQSREEALSEARAFLKKDRAAATEYASHLSGEQARALADQILFISRPGHPQIDHLNYLLSHLAQISANETGQKRLNNLLLVIVLTLVLFSCFLAFVLLDQRKIIRALNASMERPPIPSSTGQLATRDTGSTPSRKSTSRKGTRRKS